MVFASALTQEGLDPACPNVDPNAMRRVVEELPLHWLRVMLCERLLARLPVVPWLNSSTLPCSGVSDALNPDGYKLQLVLGRWMHAVPGPVPMPRPTKSSSGPVLSENSNMNHNGDIDEEIVPSPIHSCIRKCRLSTNSMEQKVGYNDCDDERLLTTVL